MNKIFDSIEPKIVVKKTKANDNYFTIRMQGDAMQDAGIFHGGLLSVQGNAKANEGDIVLALVDKDLLIRRYFRDQEKTLLMAENVNLPCIVLDEFDSYEICGVVEEV
jgi:SOS-response transcriptional repressor LexA